MLEIFPNGHRHHFDAHLGPVSFTGVDGDANAGASFYDEDDEDDDVILIDGLGFDDDYVEDDDDDDDDRR